MPMDFSKLLVSEVRNALRMLENGECGLDKIQEECAYRTIQYYKNGETHFNEDTARGCIAQMYYYVGESEKVYAPFFDYKEMKEIYQEVKDSICEYNVWDFAVTMNLIYSNHADIVKKWSKDKASLTRKITELSISFLNDEDTNHPSDKIWWYMNG